jgi:hypothetical protein
VRTLQTHAGRRRAQLQYGGADLIALLILIVIVSAAIISRLFVRSRIPEQGWFADPPRAATTLSVVGTMTAVLLAFVIFFSVQS